MLFVNPSHRRRGAARQMLTWGIGEADRLSLPIYLEATEQGRPCYEACGFRYLRTDYWTGMSSLVKPSLVLANIVIGAVGPVLTLSSADKPEEEKSEWWKEMERWFQLPVATRLMIRGVKGEEVKVP